MSEYTEDSFPGILGNVVAGRIANRLDLQGANFTVDADCAASLAALDAGIRQLRSGDADVALVGAIDGNNNATSFMSFAQTHALSPRGHCCSFDDSADGIALGEGVAALVLKRLGDAERDGDRIYAVIKGIGSSSDGRNRSLTAPHPQGQVAALLRAYLGAASKMMDDWITRLWCAKEVVGKLMGTGVDVPQHFEVTAIATDGTIQIQLQGSDYPVIVNTTRDSDFIIAHAITSD